ncbi:hypothetical protein V6N12_019847, partial [Hibiscus sabdariffa]
VLQNPKISQFSRLGFSRENKAMNFTSICFSPKMVKKE